MGKHRWPTAGDAWPPPHPVPHREVDGEGDGDGYGHPREDDAGPSPRGGIQWRVARSAALVFLGVALAVGAALFLVRSSEPSAAAVSVELDAGPPDTGPAGDREAGTGPAGSGPGPTGGASAAGSVPPGGGAGPHPQAGTGPGEGPVIVYVTGAVASPGVIEVPAGTRLVEVIERAGGALPEADLEAINLAGLPTDGQHIHLLAVGEEPRPGAEGPAPGSGGTAAPPDPAAGAAGAAGAADPAGGIIDLNTATLAEIESLPGVGPVLGQRIIDWREEHGPFTQAADVDAVPGIGPALLEGILPRVSVR
ncbi:helix-hairpin-helix domain-containing protein [Arthrobacter sp. Ld5]|uniref:helix-hairpin-helix domain-containing protein n=1 Tax=Arthrobacter sp. Ld5 TaxID=649152 RepID=UPI003EB9B0D3